MAAVRSATMREKFASSNFILKTLPKLKKNLVEDLFDTLDFKMMLFNFVTARLNS